MPAQPDTRGNAGKASLLSAKSGARRPSSVTFGTESMSSAPKDFSRLRQTGALALILFFGTAIVFTGYTVLRYYLAVLNGKKEMTFAIGAFSLLLCCGVVCGAAVCYRCLVALLRRSAENLPNQRPQGTPGKEPSSSTEPGARRS